MSEKNFIESLPQKSAFKVGLLSGLGIAFVIGFFILLGFMVNKDGNNTPSTNANPLVAIAEDIGVKAKKLEACIEEDKFASKVSESSKKAQEAGVRGTPNSLILYKDLKVRIPGALPYEQVKGMLDSMIAGETPETNEPDVIIEPINDSDWVLGNKDAEISIIEFSDLDCPYCKRFHTTMHQVIDNYDNVKWAFRHFPLPQLHPDATNKAKTAECVGDIAGNEKFWAFIDKLSIE